MALIRETNISWQMCLSPYLWLLPMSLFQRKSPTYKNKLRDAIAAHSKTQPSNQHFPLFSECFVFYIFYWCPGTKQKSYKWPENLCSQSPDISCNLNPRIVHMQFDRKYFYKVKKKVTRLHHHNHLSQSQLKKHHRQHQNNHRHLGKV